MSEHSRLIIIGAGGHGKVLADIAYQMNKWQEICFLDDAMNGKTILGFPVIGKSQDIEKYQKNSDFIIGIGDNKIRERIFQQLVKLGCSIATLIHLKAVIGLDVEILEGTVVMPGVVINTSTKIGRGVIVNTSSTVDHDCTIADFVHLSPGVHIAGTVLIGERTWIGIGSSVINNVSIGEDIIVGAGSVVINTIENQGIYFGTPSRIKGWLEGE